MGVRLLVTGASGFVGKALSARLLEEKVPLTLTSRASVAPETVAIGDLGISTDWTSALQHCETVVHLAARVHVMNDTEVDPLTAFRKVNVGGTLSLARQSAAAGVKRFVFISSVKVNGELTLPGNTFTEADTPSPQDAYGISKMEAEMGLRQLAAESGMQVVIIRPPLVYGPGVRANFAALMSSVQRSFPLPLGAVHNQRSLVALDNLIDFIITCTTHPLAANQTFLVSDGQDMSTTQLIRSMAQAASVSARLLPVPVSLLRAAASLLGKAGVVDRLCDNLQVDISKARNLLGWVPPITVQEGLSRVLSPKESLQNSANR